jgi:hypothetical protein
VAHPGTQIGGLIVYLLRHDPLGQGFEGFGFAEKGRYADQQVLGELPEFVWMVPQKVGIPRDIFHVLDPHTPADAPQQGALFIAAEIELGVGAQPGEDGT